MTLNILRLSPFISFVEHWNQISKSINSYLLKKIIELNFVWGINKNYVKNSVHTSPKKEYWKKYQHLIPIQSFSHFIVITPIFHNILIFHFVTFSVFFCFKTFINRFFFQIQSVFCFFFVSFNNVSSNSKMHKACIHVTPFLFQKVNKKTITNINTLTPKCINGKCIVTSI